MRKLVESSDHIDYEEIDPLVRGLVEFINLFPGICTVSSCAGHEPMAESYVTFKAETLADLHHLMRALPFIGERSGMWGAKHFHAVIYIMADLDGFSLRMAGWPGRYVHRRLIGEMECSLANSLSAGTHPLCSNSGIRDSADTSPAASQNRRAASLPGRLSS